MVWLAVCGGGCVAVRLSVNRLGAERGGAMAGALWHLTSLRTLEYVCLGCVVSCSGRECELLVCMMRGGQACVGVLQGCVVTVVSWIQCV